MFIYFPLRREKERKVEEEQEKGVTLHPAPEVFLSSFFNAKRWSYFFLPVTAL
jgi:hypothetical protein